MLAYAADQPRFGSRRPSPNALIFIICAHLIVIALVISANVTTVRRIVDHMPPIVSVPLPKPPPPRPIQAAHRRQPKASLPVPSTPPKAVVPVEPEEPVVTGPIAQSEPTFGNGMAQALPPLPQAVPVPVSTPAQPLTPVADLKPPYPASKLAAGEEATLTLRLTINENGRVVAVDPVGRADPVFLAAAQKHLLARWRYKPAMQGGRPVSSTAVVTLRFELDS